MPVFEDPDDSSPQSVAWQIFAENLSWHIDEEVRALSLRADDLIRAEGILRIMQGTWKSAVALVDPTLQSACEARAAALGQGADTLRTIALGRPSTGHESSGRGH